MSARRSCVPTLLRHELARFFRNPPAFMLLGCLALAAVLMSAGGAAPDDPTVAAGPMPVWVVYEEQTPWVRHLKENLPEDLPVQVRSLAEMEAGPGGLRYPPGSAAIEIGVPFRRDSDLIRYRYPGDDPNVIWPAARWFLATSFRFFAGRPFPESVELPVQLGPSAPSPDAPSLDEVLSVPVIGTLLLFTVQFFAGCALLVSHTSQDKERGTLNALAMSPASPAEILAAKLGFHLLLSLTVCGVITAILEPRALAQPLLWGTLALTSLGFAAVGTLIASLSRSQSTASLFSFAYVLAIGTVTFLSTRFPGFWWARRMTFESYGLGLLHESLAASEPAAAQASPVASFGALAGIAVAWTALAAVVFVRKGWR